MTQEVEITLTLEVDVEEDKEDIEYYIYNILSIGTMNNDSYQKMLYNNIKIKSIKEESEIYQT